jgi:hypothetical protein
MSVRRDRLDVMATSSLGRIVSLVADFASVSRRPPG